MSILDCDFAIIWQDNSFYWEGSIVSGCCGYGWRLQMTCPDSNGQATLRILDHSCPILDSDPDSDPNYLDQGKRLSNEDSTCSPISLVFGPFQAPANSFICCDAVIAAGTYYITVTE